MGALSFIKDWWYKPSYQPDPKPKTEVTLRKEIKLNGNIWYSVWVGDLFADGSYDKLEAEMLYEKILRNHDKAGVEILKKQSV